MTDVYGTVEGFVAYHTERGNLTLAAEDETEILAALLVASEWSDGTYGTLFPGWKTSGYAQDREWPRVDAYTLTGPYFNGARSAEYFATDAIPREQINATYELAGKHLTTLGSLDIDYNASDAIKKASVDGAVSVEFVGASSYDAAQTVFPVVDKIMAPLLVGDGAISANALVGRKVRA